MSTYRFLLSGALKICLLMVGVSVFAQNKPGQWVDDLYFVTQYAKPALVALIDEKNNVKKMIPHVSESTDLPIPARAC